MNRLDFLIDYLIKEDSRMSEMEIPKTEEGKRELFRALRNIRPPKPVSKEFLQLQDEELQAQVHEKGIVKVADLEHIQDENSNSHTLAIWQGDITRLQVDAIVNAANSQMLGCWAPLHNCIDNAIHSAAGIQLREECHQQMLQQGHEEPTGKAKITKGYNLPSKYVIHTVGPIIPDGIPTPLQQKQLVSCYRSIMDCADKNHLESIAFCCISTGEFRFPNHLAAKIAISTVKEYFTKNPQCGVNTIIFNVFKDIDKNIYTELLSMISKN